MFVRRLVSGVRSSCEASATSCRCAPTDCSSVAEHRVEARRRAGRARRGPRPRSRRLEVVRRGDVLGRVARAGARARAPRARRRAGGDGERDAARGDEHHQQREPVQRVVDLLRAARSTWTASPGRAARVRTRTWTPSHRRVVAGTRRRCRRRRASSGGRPGSRPSTARRQDRAVRLDELDQRVAAARAERARRTVRRRAGRRRRLGRRARGSAACRRPGRGARRARSRRRRRRRSRPPRATATATASVEPRAEAHCSGSRSA